LFDLWIPGGGRVVELGEEAIGPRIQPEVLVSGGRIEVLLGCGRRPAGGKAQMDQDSHSCGFFLDLTSALPGFADLGPAGHEDFPPVGRTFVGPGGVVVGVHTHKDPQEPGE
jgi:hypothetical protein